MPGSETGISSGLMGHLARMQTLPTYSSLVDPTNLYSSKSKIQAATFPPNELFVILTGIAESLVFLFDDLVSVLMCFYFISNFQDFQG